MVWFPYVPSICIGMCVCVCRRQMIEDEGVVYVCVCVWRY